jgi:hypothetical protein
MDRGLTVSLSPNEEVTLRRIALGVAKAKHLRPQDVTRLIQLGLVADGDGRLALTDTGRQRYGALPKAASIAGVGDVKEFAAVLKRGFRGPES